MPRPSAPSSSPGRARAALGLRRHKDRLEVVGLFVMGLGIVLLVQPLTITLFGLGFPILLLGLIFYIVVSHF